MEIVYGQMLHGFQKLSNTPLGNAVRTTDHQEDQNTWISLHQEVCIVIFAQRVYVTNVYF